MDLSVPCALESVRRLHECDSPSASLAYHYLVVINFGTVALLEEQRLYGDSVFWAEGSRG